MTALSRQDVRAVDRWAIDELGIPGVILMENAGRQVADAACRLLGSPGARRVAVMAGAGNNGGDGYVAARHLALRGAIVATFIISPIDRIEGDALINLKAIRALDHEIYAVTADAVAGLGKRLAEYDLVIDAVGGTGINGPLRGAAARAVEQINAAGRPVVAVDIPTGLDCDSGLPNDPTVKATVTVTFVARKIGFEAPGAADYTGEVIVADIGVPYRA
ncbi:MAG: NAD(P)H-hydrate epimerase [Planctomycetaceae bacterium]|nr:NAD(P)H-hydrate epimerase [Planctomycetaceae bacterium]